MVNYTERDRLAPHGARAYQAGYDARYEGKAADQLPAPFARDGALAKRWRAGWQDADMELQ